MSTFEDLIPDVEYESDTSTNSTASVARKKILKSSEKFESKGYFDWGYAVIGLVSAFVAIIASLIPIIGTKINDQNVGIQVILKLVVYIAVYAVGSALRFIGVF